MTDKKKSFFSSTTFESAATEKQETVSASDHELIILSANFFEPSDKDIPAANRCHCGFSKNDQLIEGWEVYRPQSQYVNTTIPSKTTSSDILRHLATDRSFKRVINGRKTALGRLIAGMKKAPSPPPYDYENCLRKSLSLHEHGEKYRFTNVVHGPTDFDIKDCEWKLVNVEPPKHSRRNPIRENQLCPRSLYHITKQPPRLENISRRDILIDPKKL